MSHLGTTSSSLNVTTLRELAKKELINVVDSVYIYIFVFLPFFIFFFKKFSRKVKNSNYQKSQVRGKKCLVLDKNISARLNLISDFPLLRVCINIIGCFSFLSFNSIKLIVRLCRD